MYFLFFCGLVSKHEHGGLPLCALGFPSCKMGTVIPAGIDGDCQAHSHDRVIAPPGIHRWFPQSWLQRQSCKVTSVTPLADQHDLKHGVSW